MRPTHQAASYWSNESIRDVSSSDNNNRARLLKKSTPKFDSRRGNSDFPASTGSRRRDDASSTPEHETISNNPSLMINYLPSKFSNGILPESGIQMRKQKSSSSSKSLRSTGSSTPDSSRQDEKDEIASTHPWLLNSWEHNHRNMRWNKFKWLLFTTNLMLTLYSFIAMIFCLLTWFNTFQKADVIRVGNRPELIASTLASCLGLFTSLIGWTGILLNNRSFLAVYTVLLWVVFAFILVPGYITYKRRTFNLEGKISVQWSQSFGVVGRLRVQNELSCCGYFSPFVEATVSQTCYARSMLPGCKPGYMNFERSVLKKWYTFAFVIAPCHIAVMVVGLLCSNHVNYRFGKGMMPKAYRLSLSSMAIIMDGFASQLAEQYGRTWSRSKLQGRERSDSDLSLNDHHGGSFESKMARHNPMYI